MADLRAITHRGHLPVSRVGCSGDDTESILSSLSLLRQGQAGRDARGCEYIGGRYYKQQLLRLLGSTANSGARRKSVFRGGTSLLHITTFVRGATFSPRLCFALSVLSLGVCTCWLKRPQRAAVDASSHSSVGNPQ